MLTRIKTAIRKTKIRCYCLYITGITALALLPGRLLADTSNPWGGDTSGVDPSNLQTTVATDTTNGLKTGLIVIGTSLFIAGVTVLARTLTRDADERKEHGSTVLTLIIAIIVIVVGLLLLGIAWKGLNAPQPS
tara:strand:- start:60597 stop:60998 length:402 start_codon:yes stop_codon:yes gene_type:complete